MDEFVRYQVYVNALLVASSTLLAVALEELKKYWKQYKPNRWLFPGAKMDRHISTRTVEAIFETAVKETDIKKKISVHTLRHSFATHLLEI